MRAIQKMQQPCVSLLAIPLIVMVLIIVSVIVMIRVVVVVLVLAVYEEFGWALCLVPMSTCRYNEGAV